MSTNSRHHKSKNSLTSLTVHPKTQKHKNIIIYSKEYVRQRHFRVQVIVETISIYYSEKESIVQWLTLKLNLTIKKSNNSIILRKFAYMMFLFIYVRFCILTNFRMYVLFTCTDHIISAWYIYFFVLYFISWINLNKNKNENLLNWVRRVNRSGVIHGRAKVCYDLC